MPLLDYTTKVDIFTTLGQIQGMLVKHGARQIMQDYDEEGRISAVSFTIPTPAGIQAVRLPANVEAVQRVLAKQKVKCDYAHAERVAWRIVKDWLEAQMAIIESEMVTIDEIFLPYMLDKNGETVYRLFANKALLLNGGEKMKTCKNLTENNPVDEFICSECGFMTENFTRTEIDEDFEEGIYYEERNRCEFQIQYCPNCGAKVVEK